MDKARTRGDFEPHVGGAFRLDADGQALAVRLTEAKPVGSPAQEGGREPFSLLFVGPPEPVLPQRIYRLEHAEMGALDLFLVPIGRGPEGTRYEAVFA